MLSIAKTVQYCGHQGLALNEHDESNSILTQTDSNDGNFRALLHFSVDEGDNVLKSHLNTCAQYTNPLFKMNCGKLITDEIAARVHAARSLIVLADETTDCSCKEQLSA